MMFRNFTGDKRNSAARNSSQFNIGKMAALISGAVQNPINRLNKYFALVSGFCSIANPDEALLN